MDRAALIAVCFACLIMPDRPALAQGSQVGTVSGIVESSDGVALPGVEVTASSTALQGERTTVTDVNGVYYLRALPPGEYALQLTRPEFRPYSLDNVVVGVGNVIAVNATMSPASLAETVTVTADAPPAIATMTTGRAYDKREIDALPIGRRPADLAAFSPGVSTPPTTAAGQIIMGGAFGFDNVFMVNGVDVNDNILGTANDLFIEDAIQEASVLTHGISAEYGRFSGGVVNIVTKSGGNTFSGSFRQNISNPAWIAETPRQVDNQLENPSLVSHTYEGTFGGPIVLNRLWFFGAGRYENSDSQHTFTQTGGAFTRTATNTRGELKLTGAVAPGHTMQGSYINNATEQANTSGVGLTRLVDASTLYTRQLPNHLLAVNYRGVLAQRALATLQYSQKRQGRRNNGGTSPDIFDSPFLTQGASGEVPGFLFYHAPFFDATDPEDRNNRQVTGSLSYLASTDRYGSHDLTAGAEYFVSTGVGGNSQSPSGSVFVTDYVVQDGQPVVDDRGRPNPRFVPGVSEVWNFLATRGATIDIKTTSFYLQDRWTVTPRLTLQLGARIEAVRGDATGDITTVDTTSIAPRLGAAFDVRGDGATVVQATYGHYAGKYNQVQFSANTNVGRPSEVDYVYSGPAGQGSDFAPGFDLSNYTQVTYANFPTANVQVDGGLRSPTVREFTLALGQQLGQRGDVKATYAWRATSNFVEDIIDLTTGVTDIPMVGTVSNRVFRNTDEPTREYQAVIIQTGHRPSDALTVRGDYTLQLRNHGNFVGETANQPGIPSIIGDYPEVFGPALDRLAPTGRLDSYQRHTLRVYGVYSQRLGRLGSVDLSPIWSVRSGGVYGHSAPIRLTPEQLALNPGYPAGNINPFVRQTVFFGSRGQYDFKGYGVLDLAATYSVPVWRSAAPWFKVEIYNALNNQKTIRWDTTVGVDSNSPDDANGIPTGFVEGPRYGTATSDAHFTATVFGTIGRTRLQSRVRVALLGATFSTYNG
ncbi:MAG: TonB-dependent receptor [Acidobacteria bacterium]|nr:TonB-dependent receptor [Acidobacteriota bacterium]